MSHPDDLTPIDRAIAQTERLMHECFRMATRLVMSDSGAADFESREARERAQAFIPLLAMDIKSNVQNLVNLDETPPRHLEKAQESVDEIISAMKKRNDQKG